MKIASKIIITLSLFFAAAVAVIGFFAGTYSANAIKGKIYSYLQSSNRARAEHIRTFLRDQKETSEILAAASVYLDLLKTQENDSQYSVIREKIRKRFIRTLEIDKNIYEIYILDKNGKVVAGSDEDEAGEDRATDAFFTEAKTKTYIKNIYFYENINKLVYTVSSPIKDNNGEFLGVSVLMFSPELFYGIVKSENGLGPTEENFLIDGEKYFITPSLFLGEDAILKQKVETENASECFDKAEEEYVSVNGYSGLIHDHDKIFINAKDYRGVDIIGTHAYIPETGWCLITKVDKSLLDKDILNLTIVNTIILGAVFIGLVFLVYFLTRRVLAGLKILEESIKKVEGGDLDAKISIKRSDEIGFLSSVFEKMVLAVKESRKDVDKKVQDQTKEIKEKSARLEDQQKAMLNILEDVEKSADELKKFKLAVDNASDHIVITDSEGIVLYGNKIVEQITGYSLEEALGKKAGTLWRKPMEQKFYENLWKTIKKDKKPFVGQITNVRKGGEVYEAAINISPVLDKNENVVYFVGIERDITKEKQIDRAKTEFVSLASHQLRTPLSTISWYAEMLLDGDAGELNNEQKKFLNEIYTGNRRMVELVGALLNVSRLELGTFMIEPEKCSLEKIAKQAVSDILPQITGKKQTLKEEYAKSLPEAFADKKLLDIIFQNLLSNAMKYTPEKGKIKLSINKDKENFIISVSDTGMGIPKGAQDKIFTKLFRADNVRESDTVGTGLGLYMVKSILEQSGGKIWFKSKENKGTTFFVSIPLSGMKKKEGAKQLTK